jgi:glycine/D-amino acid oxidase-like deaminating enzyme
MANCDAIVVGGGVVGIATAYHLVAPGRAQVLIATGPCPVGRPLGPYSGRVIAGIVGRGAPGIDRTPFRVDRFR